MKKGIITIAVLVIGLAISLMINIGHYLQTDSGSAVDEGQLNETYYQGVNEGRVQGINALTQYIIETVRKGEKVEIRAPYNETHIDYYELGLANYNKEKIE